MDSFFACQHARQIRVLQKGLHGSLKYCTTAINGMLAGNYDGLDEFFFPFSDIHRSFVSSREKLMVELEFQFMTMRLVLSWQPISIINEIGNTGISSGVNFSNSIPRNS